jgi:hypothetical protein
VKIACAHCRQLFVPSPAQRATMRYGTVRHYCSHACVCAAKRAPQQTSQTVVPKPPPIAWVYDLHIRTPDIRAFRRLLRALDDDLELVRVWRSEGQRQRWALQMVPSRRDGEASQREVPTS